MFSIEIGDQSIELAINQTDKRIVTALGVARDALLDEIEATQIHAYTASGEPGLPPGSDYERTFTLRGASRKEPIGDLAGRWYVDESIASYGRYVIGERSEQAPIHQGRWKSTEDVEAEVARKATEIIERTLEKLL